jgi:hypothetical protein
MEYKFRQLRTRDTTLFDLIGLSSTASLGLFWQAVLYRPGSFQRLEINAYAYAESFSQHDRA